MLLSHSWGDPTVSEGADTTAEGDVTAAAAVHQPRPWVPATPSEVALCSTFLDYLARASPTVLRSLLDVHLGFLSVLSQRWIPAGA